MGIRASSCCARWLDQPRGPVPARVHAAVARDVDARPRAVLVTEEREPCMRLAVFTSKYPAQVSTFFERDMRALIETGMEIDVFSIYPLDASEWGHSLELLGPSKLPRHRIHHLELMQALKLARPVLRRGPQIPGGAAVSGAGSG